MPLFEYQCNACGEAFEVIKSSSNKDPEPCPECGEPAEKLFSVFARSGGGGSVCSPGSGGSFGGG